jgi:DNA-binding response OmpR family regulator
MDPLINLVTYYILIVDDERDDHFFLNTSIKKIIPQAVVESLYDGSEALKYLENCITWPNLIFLDLNMHKLSGKETMKVIRKNPTLCKVPVIILTTSRNEDEKKEILELGASAFYSKPYNYKDLDVIVQEVRDKYLSDF